jgi:predicted dehydrogenase
VSSGTLGAYEQPTTICPRLTDDPIMMMLVPEVEEFGRAIAEDREPAVTMHDARRVLRVLDAALLSARTREPVQLETTSRRR